MDAENFWVMNKKDDAVKMSKEAIAQGQAFETIAVSADGRSAGSIRGGQGGRWHMRRVPQAVPRPERGQDVSLKPALSKLLTAKSRPRKSQEVPEAERLGVASWRLGSSIIQDSFAFLNTPSIIAGVSFPVFVFCRLG